MASRTSLFPKSVLRCISGRETCNFSQRRSIVSGKSGYVKVSEEVREAIDRQRPVVALETTIYTHGFPHPENTALATHLESVVRANGAVPATIGILDGVARVGLSAEELIQLTAAAGKPETRKVSRRDLAPILGLGRMARKLTGGTTIAGTMILASLAGIKVFATGGLGGVHRGGESSMDISADLTELGRTKIAVIAGGCKGFLDIPRTLEYLETQGVTVGTFSDGRDGNVDFPAFWTRNSGVASPLTVRNEEEAAHMIHVQHGLPLCSGLFFANPVPEEHSIQKSELDEIMAQAIHDARATGFVGSDNTPYILQRIRELTSGASVTANRALVEANVARGAKVAVEFHRLRHRSRILNNPQTTKKEGPMPIHSQASADGKKKLRRNGQHDTVNSKNTVELAGLNSGIASMHQPADVVVAGSLAVDLSCNFIPPGGDAVSVQPQARTSNPASINQKLGGVGQNLSTAINYLGSSVCLCSSVGNDVASAVALQMLSQRGLGTTGIRTIDNAHTAQYVAVNDTKKDLVVAMADMSILEAPNDDFDTIWKPYLANCKPRWLVLDSNWDAVTLHRWLDTAQAMELKVAYEPVSVAKSKRLFSSAQGSLGVTPKHRVSLASPNILELGSMHDTAHSGGFFESEDWWAVINSIGLPNSGSQDRLVHMTNHALVNQGIPQQSIRLLPFIPCILTTMGEHGVLMTQMLGPSDPRLTSPDSGRYILSRSTDGNRTVGGVYMRLFSPVERVSQGDIVSVNGVGDTFLGVLIAGLAQQDPKDLADLIDIAQKGSVLTLKSEEAVSPLIASLRSSL